MGSSGVPVYRGRFGPAQAERLLWRAGFGPRPGEGEAYARKGLEGAVRALLAARGGLTGPEPSADGQALDPLNTHGDDLLWWLDRMVRSERPHVERMTLVWHDWFATSNRGVGSQRLMLRQNELFRRFGRGSFERLITRVTSDPAMLVWLSGNRNRRLAPNENYAREMMELFTLGAGRGYSEHDVRQQARALTGWRSERILGEGPVNFRYVADLHDPGFKRIFGKRGRFDWRDSPRLSVHHRKHPSFFVGKLWSYFIPGHPSVRSRRGLERLYLEHDYAIKPVLRAILMHPRLYRGPRMVKPPAVYAAGMLRALRRPVDTRQWVWILALSGQQLFSPPSVAGWDESRWIDTATFRGRWAAARCALEPFALDPVEYAGELPSDPAALVQLAIDFWRDPWVSTETRAALVDFGTRALADADRDSKRERYPVHVLNSLRQLLAVSPDLQTC